MWRPPTRDGYRAGRRRDGTWRVERDGSMVADEIPTAREAAHVIAWDRGRRRAAFERAVGKALAAGRVPVSQSAPPGRPETW